MTRVVSIAAAWVLLLGGSSCALHSRPVSSVGTGATTNRGDTSGATADEPTAREQPPAPPRPAPKADPGSPPAKPPAKKDPERPASPEPKLLSDDETVDEVRAKVDRALEVATRVGERSLSVEQADLLLAGRQFLSESSEAVAAGDLQRASLLADKALVILEDLELSTRP